MEQTSTAEVLVFRRGKDHNVDVATIATNGRMHVSQELTPSGPRVKEHATLIKAIAYLASLKYNIDIDNYRVI